MNHYSDHESGVISRSNERSLQARKELFQISLNYSASSTERERSTGLFIRASLMARFLGILEAYEKIVSIPGAILDIGTWRGQTAVLCENYRAILEPLNLDRRIYAFDTFQGYVGFGDRDKVTDLHHDGTYTLEDGYPDLLRRILELHEASNAMGHITGKHSVIVGDVQKTLEEHFSSHPNFIVALTFLDLNAVVPTEESIGLVWNRMVPGAVLAFWQLTQPSVPGDGVAYVNKVLGFKSHSIERSRFYPGLVFVTKTESNKVGI